LLYERFNEYFFHFLYIILNDVCYVYKHELIYLISKFFDISANFNEIAKLSFTYEQKNI